LWRRPRPKLGCGAKERKKERKKEGRINSSHGDRTQNCAGASLYSVERVLGSNPSAVNNVENTIK